MEDGMKVTLERLEDARSEVEQLENQYLTERGWVHSCGYPDSCWRWQKEGKDFTYVCRKDEALQLEERMSANAALAEVHAKCAHCANREGQADIEQNEGVCRECEEAALSAV
jgi:hypothetical protein